MNCSWQYLNSNLSLVSEVTFLANATTIPYLGHNHPPTHKVSQTSLCATGQLLHSQLGDEIRRQRRRRLRRRLERQLRSTKEISGRAALLHPEDVLAQIWRPHWGRAGFWHSEALPAGKAIRFHLENHTRKWEGGHLLVQDLQRILWTLI